LVSSSILGFFHSRSVALNRHLSLSSAVIVAVISVSTAGSYNAQSSQTDSDSQELSSIVI